MLDNNKIVSYSGDEIIEVLREIDYILISLHKMGSYYAETLPNSYTEYANETTRFIDENNVTKRLASVRKVLSCKFDDTLGDDDMGDIERALETIDYWKPKK